MPAYCTHCGTALTPGSLFCPKCGEKIAPEAQSNPTSPPNPTPPVSPLPEDQAVPPPYNAPFPQTPYGPPPLTGSGNALQKVPGVSALPPGMRVPVVAIVVVLVLFLLSKMFSHSAATTPTQSGPTSPVQGGALGSGGATTTQADVFQGRCTTEQGTPLANVDVKIAGLSSAGENTVTEVHTDANGNYSQSLPAGKYSIYNALYPVTLGSTSYLLPLALTDGENNDDDDIGPGITRNLVLHIHGKIAPSMPDTEWQSFYGGNLICGFYGRYLVPGTPAGSVTELTLVPSGPLADGTTGQTLTLRVTNDVTNEGTYANFLDIPIGQYTITARLLNADGTLIEPLIIAPTGPGQDTSRYSTTMTNITFPPSNFTNPYPAIGQGGGIGLLQLDLNDGNPGT